MTERPILFSAPMVRALLDGTKTQTRRVVKPVRGYEHNNVCRPDMAAEPWNVWWHGKYETVGVMQGCPYGQPGDRLWVRETFALSVIDPDGGPPEDDPENYDVIYRATDTPGGGWTDGDGNVIPAPWKSSIHMPRWASRILLEITSVRVERLQDISDEDAIAEGICRVGPGWERWHADPDDTEHTGSTQKPRLSYLGLWESINGAGSWDANPWVWVVEFKRVTP